MTTNEALIAVMRSQLRTASTWVSVGESLVLRGYKRAGEYALRRARLCHRRIGVQYEHVQRDTCA